MTDTEAPERHELITRDEQGRPTALATLAPGQTAQFLPKSVSELAHVAKFAADVGMFGVTRQGVAFNIMLAGAHLGLTPYASLEGITLINGRPVVSAQVQWTLILSRGGVEEFSIDSDEKHCSITVRSRKWREPKTQTVTMEDVPPQLASKQTYKQHGADMLFAFCVRRLRKRYFPEVMVGALDNGDVEAIEGHAEARVVDVGTVEERVPEARETPPCEKVLPGYGDGTAGAHICGLPTELVPGRSGGMFLRCTAGHMMPPPQAVRDAIRGHRDGTAAIQREEVTHEASVAGVAAAETSAPVRSSGGHEDEAASNVVADRGAPATPVGATLPLGEAHDDGFMEAAGIAPEAAAPEPEPLTRAEVDTFVQAILRAVTHARALGSLKAAQTILHAHGWDDTPLSSWLVRHPQELPGLVAAFAEPGDG